MICSLGQKNYRDTTPPSVTDFQINVRICVSQVSNDKRRRSDSVLNPLHHIAYKRRKVCSFAHEARRSDCILNTVMVDVIQLALKRHSNEDVRLRV